jgi:outer membrane receptor protein involved in Fe transport
VHPWIGDVYLRDRLDFEGFTGNLGVRADYWFLGREVEEAINDAANTNITPESRAEFYNSTKSFYGRRYKVKISPRVIVAHPITEHSSFFFNYGQFTQIPSYRYVYSKLTSISSESFPLLGNPNLNPQVSVNYEVGAKNQFSRQAAINLTFFVKDIYDYPVATTFSRLEGSTVTPFFVYLNGHFARSRGFEIELEKRRSAFWSGKLTYTFQQTKGKSSDPNEQKVVQENGGDASETRLSETYVRWNRPHKLTASFDLRFEKDAPRSWLRHTGVNLFIQGLSGRAYTPSNPLSNQAAEPNSQNAPFQITTDVRFNRYIPMGSRRLDFSITGTNIFNNFVINRVDPVSGRGRVWGAGSYDPALFPDTRNDNFLKQSQVDDPSNYGPGAQWRMSLDYDF